MKIYDLTQEVFGCCVFPGDPAPKYEQVLKISEGAVCNLTKIEMCSHNGTHVDAPKHFYDDKLSIDKMPLEKFIGEAYVIEHSGEITGNQLRKIFLEIKADNPIKKILFKKNGKGINVENTVVSLEAAKVINEFGIELVGVESQTVGPMEAPAEVHYELLKNDVVLLEGLVLSKVPVGKYFLSAAPLKLGDCDGAPCRAVLIENN